MINSFSGFPKEQRDMLRQLLGVPQTKMPENKVSQDFPTQGDYYSMQLNERGTFFTQEAIRDRTNNLLIISVPAHNGNFAAKNVYDGNSDLMMVVRFDISTCTIQKSFLQGDIDTAFKAMNPRSMERSAMDRGNLKVVKKYFTIITGYEIKPEALPAKFQPHCPPDFKAYVAHTVNGTEPSMENLLDSDNLLEAPGDFFDFQSSIQLIKGKQGRNSQYSRCHYVLSNGTVVQWKESECAPVKFNCSDGTSASTGCPRGNYRFNCVDKEPHHMGCVYEIAYCYDNSGVLREPCLNHLYYGARCCRPCCVTRDCHNLKQCKTIANVEAILRACPPRPIG